MPRAALLALAAAAGVAAYSTPVPVFEAYKGYPPCFRQPLLLSTSADGQKLVVFAEGRNNTYCSGTNDGNIQTIAMRTSADGGATWADAVTMYTGHVDYLGAVYSAKSDKVYLFVQQGSAVLFSTVTDNGGSYTPLTPITLKMPPGVTSIQPAVGTGLVIDGSLCAEPTCGGTAGRLVMPFVCHSKGAPPPAAAARQLQLGPGDVACPGCYSCLVTSDDDGATWAFGAVSAQDGSREASPVQVASASFGAAGAAVWVTERNMGNETGARFRAVSADGGRSFVPALYGIDAALPDGSTKNWTGVVSGASRYDTVDAGTGKTTRRVIFTAPASHTDRVNMGLYVSTDEAHTWTPAPALIWPGPAAYSNTVQLNATHAGVIFECGEAEFAQRISFATIAVSDLPPAVASN